MNVLFPNFRCSVVVALATLVAALSACSINSVPTDDTDDCSDCARLAGDRPAILRDYLHANLISVMERDVTIFGQQRFNITGVEPSGSQWLADVNRVDKSDARTLAGHHPGVLGIDVWDLAIKPATWSPTPAVHAEAARRVFSLGGVVTMEWHMRGCNTDSFYAADNEDCLCRLANDDSFARSWLIDGKLARYADAIEAHSLRSVPIIFRPLHEMTGNWFWWGFGFWNCEQRVDGATVSGPAAYQRVFRIIVDYLRDERGLDNLLFAYSPDKLDRGFGDSEEARYLSGYPGDDYVDVMGIDLYYLADQSASSQTERYRRYLRLLTRLARDRGKVAALTETGNYRLGHEHTPADSRWFTDTLLPLISGDEDIRLAFALTWENRRAAPNNFYVPYPGHAGEADFQRFVGSTSVWMLDDLPNLYGLAGPGGGENQPTTCASCASDSDGDGVGVEDGVACLSPPSCLEPTPYPTCASCESDPDGDGWGWEEDASCITPPPCQGTPS